MWYDNANPVEFWNGPNRERITVWADRFGFLVTLNGERIGSYRRKSDAKRAILRRFPEAKKI